MSGCLHLLLAYMLAASSSAAASLYYQSVARLLAEHYPSRDLSYLLIDADTGRLIASRWDRIAEPVPVGSLVKPFLALAYAQKHNFRYPTYFCHGTADGCWLSRGHGQVDISSATAYSCNAYFLSLAKSLKAEDLDSIAWRYGLSIGKPSIDTGEMIGLGTAWRAAPEELLHAYLLLTAAPQPPGAAELLRGMALCTQRGTAEAVGRNLEGSFALAKTGTAPCVHEPRAPGDGFVLMLYPADQPRLALLVRVHGVPGARAAQVGGRMLNSVVKLP
jgi:cell division protein FtsI/penicillin-binding protein 2